MDFVSFASLLLHVSILLLWIVLLKGLGMIQVIKGSYVSILLLWIVLLKDALNRVVFHEIKRFQSFFSGLYF